MSDGITVIENVLFVRSEAQLVRFHVVTVKVQY